MNNTKQKILSFDRIFVLVGEGGFEPPKRDATDLQSAPFGHSGTLPGAGDGTRTRDLLITNQLLCQLSYTGKKWALTGSNRRHSACKADALPAELNALMKMTCTGFEPVNASVKGW